MSLNVVPAVGGVLERILDDTYPAVAGRAEPSELRALLGGAAEDRMGPSAPRPGGPAGRPARGGQREAVRSVAAAGRTHPSRARHRSGVHRGTLRGRGAAKELLTRMIEIAEAEGFEFAALSSEIAPRLYEQLDFVPVPLTECRITSPKGGRPPAMLVRSGEDRDLPAISEIRRRAQTRAPGRRAQRGLHHSQHRQEAAPRRARATRAARGGVPRRQEGHQSVAYIVCVSHRGSWFVEDAGDRDPTGARLGAMLQVMLALHPGEATPKSARGCRTRCGPRR